MLGKPSEQLLEAISGQDWSDDIRAQARRFVRKVGDNKADEILDQAQGRTELSEIQWEVCIECWLSRAETRDDDWTFVTLVAEWIKDTQAVGIQRALRLANRVAWETAGDPHEPTKEAFSGFRHETPEAVFQVALYADRARFLPAQQTRPCSRCPAQRGEDVAVGRGLPRDGGTWKQHRQAGARTQSHSKGLGCRPRC